MIRHIVFFTAKNKADIDHMVEGLSVLASIPYARRLDIARNRKSDQLANDIDVVVYGEFDSEGNLAAGRNPARTNAPGAVVCCRLRSINRCAFRWALAAYSISADQLPKTNLMISLDGSYISYETGLFGTGYDRHGPRCIQAVGE
ncbi:Dabb family protein [Bradyrhizobium sp. USDA 4516]